MEKKLALILLLLRALLSKCYNFMKIVCLLYKYITATVLSFLELKTARQKAIIIKNNLKLFKKINKSYDRVLLCAVFLGHITLL